MFPFLFHVLLVATSDCSTTGVKLYACGVGCNATTSTSSSSSSTTILIPNSWPSSPVNGHAVLEQLHIRLINTHHTHFCVGASCFVISGAIFLFMSDWWRVLIDSTVSKSRGWWNDCTGIPRVRSWLTSSCFEPLLCIKQGMKLVILWLSCQCVKWLLTSWWFFGWLTLMHWWLSCHNIVRWIQSRTLLKRQEVLSWTL